MLITVSKLDAVGPILSALGPEHTVFYRKNGLSAEQPYIFLKDGNVIFIHPTTATTEAALLAAFPNAINLNGETILSVTAI